MDISHIARATLGAVLALAFSAAAHASPLAYAPDPPPATAEMYRTWIAAVPGRDSEVRAYEDFLANQGVAGVFPTYETLRSESLWSECGGEPFALAARAEWPHIVGTLRFIRDQVVPKIGPLQIVSGYRSPALNVCSGGAAASAHVAFWALDLEPVGDIDLAAMTAALCPIYDARGAAANIGLGFYEGRRFHIDSKSHRTWGADTHKASSPCSAVGAHAKAIAAQS